MAGIHLSELFIACGNERPGSKTARALLGRKNQTKQSFTAGMVVSSVPLTEARPSVALVPMAGERQGGPGTGGRAAGLLSAPLSPWPRWFRDGRGAQCCTAAALCTGGNLG